MSEPQVEVTVQWPGHPERRLVLAQGITHLGRAEDNELVLPDAGVSRKHARIKHEGSILLIEDLGSGNGVWFRGNRVERMDLKDGDQVYIDPFTLTFRVQARQRAVVISASTSAAVAAPQPAPATPVGPRPRGQLTTLSGPKLQPVYPLRDPITSLGRSNQRDIILFDPASSRLQAEILIQDGGFWIKDGGSANGTFLNGEPARSQRLKDGDRIRIGGTEFRFDALSPEGAPAEIPPTRARSTPTAASTPEVAWDRSTQLLPPAPPVAHAAGRGGGQKLLLAGVVLVALFLLFVSGAFFLLALREGGGLEKIQQALYTRPEPLPPAPPMAAEVRAGLDEGRALYDQGKTMDALAKYRGVWRLDEDNVLAQHMVYVSCEALALKAMRDDLVARSTPVPPPRKGSR